MKWFLTFLSGALLGALALYGYRELDSRRPVSMVARGAIVIAPATVPALAPATTEETVAASVPEATVPVAHQLLIPVAGIQASALNDTFNQPRGSERRHEAIDIVAPNGTRVVAVADGKIAKLFNSQAGGLTVYQFDPGEQFAYYYAHLDRYAADVQEGMTLKRGDLVGYVGTSGNADPNTPHLHFAIFALEPQKQWWRGSPVNPYPLLGGAERP